VIDDSDATFFSPLLAFHPASLALFCKFQFQEMEKFSASYIDHEIFDARKSQRSGQRRATNKASNYA
jgi:hypothetical protein